MTKTELSLKWKGKFETDNKKAIEIEKIKNKKNKMFDSETKKTIEINKARIHVIYVISNWG